MGDHLFSIERSLHNRFSVESSENLDNERFSLHINCRQLHTEFYPVFFSQG